MAKAAEAFRTISEVADDLGIQKHVLRFWEVKFNQIRPMKRGGGRRYYRPEDMELLRGIRQLLHKDGYTIKGVQKILREQGVEAVKSRLRDDATDEAAPSGAPSAPPSSETKRDAAAVATGGRRKKGRRGVPDTDPKAVLDQVIAELVACRELLAGEPIADRRTSLVAGAQRRQRRSA